MKRFRKQKWLGGESSANADSGRMLKKDTVLAFIIAPFSTSGPFMLLGRSVFFLDRLSDRALKQNLACLAIDPRAIVTRHHSFSRNISRGEYSIAYFFGDPPRFSVNAQNEENIMLYWRRV